jgi:fatty acid desaturase
VEAAIARRYELGSGETAWPTVALFFAALAAQAALAALALQAFLPVWLGVAACAICAYAQFTVLHDAVHRSLSKRRWLNEALGAAAALTLFAPYEAFRRNHLHHHAHTNDPASDPDYWVAGETWLSTAARCLTMLQFHYYSYIFKLGRRDAVWGRTWATIAGMALALAAGSALGAGRALLLFWWLPAQLAVAALGFLFDYWPHRPHLGRGRMKDTAVIAPRWLDPAFLAQNLHLVHHLWPTIPWYRYRAAFRETEPALREEGGLIWDFWTALARLKPSPLGRMAS